MQEPVFPRAVLFVYGALEPHEQGHRLISPGLAATVRTRLSGTLARRAERLAGAKRFFEAYPRTSPEGALVHLTLARTREAPPAGFVPGQGEAIGRLVFARRDLLVVEVAPRPPRKPFRLTLLRADAGRPHYVPGGGLIVRLALRSGRLWAEDARTSAVHLPGDGPDHELLAPCLPPQEAPERPGDPDR